MEEPTNLAPKCERVIAQFQMNELLAKQKLKTVANSIRNGSKSFISNSTAAAGNFPPSRS